MKRTPVLAGVCGTDPFRDIPRFLASLKQMGFSGVQNFPTVGLFDGKFRANIEETGMGFAKEVEMVTEARKLGLLTTPYAFTPGEAAAMAAAGADIVVAHVGLTTAGTIGAATSLTLDDATSAVQAMADAAREVNPHVLVLCHGGPIATPAVGLCAQVYPRSCHQIVLEKRCWNQPFALGLVSKFALSNTCCLTRATMPRMRSK